MAPKLTLQTVFSMVDKVTKPLGALQSKVGKLGSSAFAEFGRAGQGVSRFTSLIGAAAAAITTGAMAKAVVSFAKTADEIGKTSKVLGLSTKSYQELTYAAKIQGVEQEQLDQGVKLFNRSLGEMKMKQGALYTALSKTNPALGRQLRAAKSTDEAFMLMLDSLGKETNAQKRATIAQAAFGKSGQNLIKLLDDGVGGFDALRKEAHLYGAVIDDDAIKAGDDFGDSLDRLKGLARGFANEGLGKIVEKLGPVLQKGAEWIANNKDLIDQKIDEYFDKISGGIQSLTGAWNSGLIPAVLAAVEAYKIVKGAAIAYNAILLITASLDPFRLIVMGVALLVGLSVLVIKNWDKVKGALTVAAKATGAAFSWLWEGIKSGAGAAFGFVKMMGMTVADALLTTFGELIKALIWVYSKVGRFLGFDTSGLDEAVGKITNLQKTMRAGSAIGLVTGENTSLEKPNNNAPLQKSVAPIGPSKSAPIVIPPSVTSPLGAMAAPVSSPFAPAIAPLGKSTPKVEVTVINEAPKNAPAPAQKAVPMSPNFVAIESRMMTENRSTLDLNINQLPAGSTAKQTGAAPGININIGAYGRAQAGYK
jgi:hypothetical protein